MSAQVVCVQLQGHAKRRHGLIARDRVNYLALILVRDPDAASEEENGFFTRVDVCVSVCSVMLRSRGARGYAHFLSHICRRFGPSCAGLGAKLVFLFMLHQNENSNFKHKDVAHFCFRGKLGLIIEFYC